MDYKHTLQLPQTSFPMKANLPTAEPRWLRRWEEQGLYAKIVARARGRERYILHDGPPYANGHIHIGTALNKILKDFIVKSKFMAGFASDYVPGWDCHGLPIEHEVDKKLGRREGVGLLEKRRLCREYAERFIRIQREEFKRLGVFGEWEHPYLTMHPGYQATIVREFGRFAGRGHVYRGKKPVHWCLHCTTALAEAEVEYQNHRSPSIYVKFPLPPSVGERLPALRGVPSSVVIWTTTPWTLPANLAIALHPEYEYVAVRVGDEAFVVAAGLLEAFLAAIGRPAHEVLARFPSRALEGVRAQHPFLARDSVLILGEHVTLEAGTGAVHIAPGHGQEDYELGLRHGLDIYTPVDDLGRFTADVPLFAGQQVFKANPAIVATLRDRGMLLKDELLDHSYPHCWRCKHPVIFRSTQQWFIALDHAGLRQRALDQILKVAWVPPWGKDRIYAMVENRPDWCISRQRAWGVPIVVFYCQGCGQTVLDEAVIAHVAEQIRQEGADLWFARSAAELLPTGYACPRCGGQAFEKERDILDVWFDSGVSWAAVLEARPNLKWPCDLYLEGSDQHRGWFHSALLTAVGTREQAPYRTVLTHGFVVDGQGRKMSKSLGNVIVPQEVIEQHGAEVLRLWVAAEDYREDIRISAEILTRLVEAYRRIRNTARFILGNLYDFDPERDAVADPALEELDRFALLRLSRLIRRVRGAYETFEFHLIYHALHNFCAVDLSAFYLDVLKDRLYCSHPHDPARRSAQTVLNRTLRALAQLMAPLLPFTAEEIWSHLPGVREESVHLTGFPDPSPQAEDPVLEACWERLLKVRGEVYKVLEAARQRKEIGSSLDAQVILAADGSTAGLLREQLAQLPALFIVSQVSLDGPADGPWVESAEVEGLRIQALPASGRKCARCWTYSEVVGRDTTHPELCARCARVVRAM
ncbi:MAG: isoleucine--tRNA ligase [Deltaproteobacteria bacterium]|nr:isoleucine--tRNA ligase [Deltaproteobacteria bacterium]